MNRYISLLVLLFIALSPGARETSQTTHHQLEVTLRPEQGSLAARDTISLPVAVSSINLQLHAELALSLLSPDASIINISSIDSRVPVKQYTIQFTRPSQTLTVEYAGKIFHELSSRSENYAGDRSSTPGQISLEGVFLSGNSYWYPQLASRWLSFSLSVTLPEDWASVSQGGQIKPNQWVEPQPQDDIYLIAAPFHVYHAETPIADALVFLKQPDEELAHRYLEATETYLQLYQSLLGEYPYNKFAVVENFWETGYGMPSFTLLGPRVIRLPFILHTSFPHEILHNWWGNSVYIDYAGGNWAEGLTSYLADHLLQEQQGKGAEYRRNSMQKYADYVADASDFPLTEFVSRHGEVSQAVGYSKTLMMFHMLRKQLGDSSFIAGLRRFYRDNRFRFASYEDLRSAFEHESAGSLTDFFIQWTSRTGAPMLALDEISVYQKDDTWRLRGRLRQTQAGDAFLLNVPVFVQMQDHGSALPFNLQMEKSSRYFDLELPARPLRISVDPRFELFRKLLPAELPPSLGQMFGAEKVSILLPVDAPTIMKQAWQDLANRWQSRSSGIEIFWDTELSSLPQQQAVWIFGRENRFATHIRNAVMQHGLLIKEDDVNWQGQDYPIPDHSLALVVRHPQNKDDSVGFIDASSPAALPALARKLPHYGRYSMTLFSGSNATNLLKIQWPLTESPLQISLTEQEIPPIAIPPLQPLVR